MTTQDRAANSTNDASITGHEMTVEDSKRSQARQVPRLSAEGGPFANTREPNSFSLAPCRYWRTGFGSACSSLDAMLRDDELGRRFAGFVRRISKLWYLFQWAVLVRISVSILIRDDPE
jgi:hypothetical protein